MDCGLCALFDVVCLTCGLGAAAWTDELSVCVLVSGSVQSALLDPPPKAVALASV